MRKLASIQRIQALEPIPDASAIEKARVLGWQLVVKKNEFSVGDLVVYCEVDCLMPETPHFLFLKPHGMRIRTVRLRGQISQGICFPLTILPEGILPEEGLDVTETLGIVKYEAPVPEHLSGQAKGYFPTFIPKTDEPRVQVMQEVLDTFRGTPCYVAEKLDGASATFYCHEGVFGVCTRNLELLETPENALWSVARRLGLEEKLRAWGGDFALQGEIVGPGIQGNKYRLKQHEVFFFNIFDIKQYAFFPFEALQKRLAQLELPSVPIVERHLLLHDNIPEWVAYSEGPSALYAVQREGIVVRPLLEQNTVQGRLSFKVISPEFLLKFD